MNKPVCALFFRPTGLTLMKTFPAESHLSSRRNPGGRFAGGLLLVALLWSPSLLAQQPADRSVEKTARVIERGAHHAKWETVRELRNPANGATSLVTNSFVQLETGLHFRAERGDWVPASDQIEILPGEAVARHGQHKARWAANINTYGAIELTMPEGGIARSHVLGLAFFDPATGNSVMIAEIKDSIGGVRGNRVIYRDAFEGVLADLRYTYTKSGLVQDVIIREQLPDPVELGFDVASVQLQVLTEFVALPAHEISDGQSLDRQQTQHNRYSSDQQIRFGAMQMMPGRAFHLGDEEAGSGIAVRKRLEKFDGSRDVLVETVDYRASEDELRTLPPGNRRSASIDTRSLRKNVNGMRSGPAAPARHWAANATPVTETGTLMASIDYEPTSGYVIDYDLTGSVTNLVLQGDTTYYVTGPVTASGVTKIEGGTVVKYASTNSARIDVTGSIECLTGPYRPAIFTAKDDNVVGITISGSTGSPSGYYGTVALGIAIQPATQLKHLQIRHATVGLQYPVAGVYHHTVSHSQIGNVQSAISTGTLTYVDLRNVLVHNATLAFQRGGDDDYVTGEHVTFNNVSAVNPNPALASVILTNCLLVNVSSPGTYSGAGNASVGSATGVLQSVGTGDHYLVAGSAHRNAGVTNISRQLQQEDDWRTPSWQKQWLSEGRVPPGYEVDHIKPLSIGGADTPANMRLLLGADHDLWHSIYHPWTKRK